MVERLTFFLLFYNLYKKCCSMALKLCHLATFFSVQTVSSAYLTFWLFSSFFNCHINSNLSINSHFFYHLVSTLTYPFRDTTIFVILTILHSLVCIYKLKTVRIYTVKKVEYFSCVKYGLIVNWEHDYNCKQTVAFCCCCHYPILITLMKQRKVKQFVFEFSNYKLFFIL